MTPLGGMRSLFFLLIGCITPGGVGTGLYDMLLIAIIAVFIAGLARRNVSASGSKRAR